MAGVDFFFVSVFFLAGAAFLFGAIFLGSGYSSWTTSDASTASSSGAEPLKSAAFSSIYWASIRPANADVASFDYKLSSSAFA